MINVTMIETLTDDVAGSATPPKNMVARQSRINTAAADG